MNSYHLKTTTMNNIPYFYISIYFIHSVCMSTESDPVHTNRGDMYGGTVD